MLIQAPVMRQLGGRSWGTVSEFVRNGLSYPPFVQTHIRHVLCTGDPSLACVGTEKFGGETGLSLVFLRNFLIRNQPGCDKEFRPFYVSGASPPCPPMLTSRNLISHAVVMMGIFHAQLSPLSSSSVRSTRTEKRRVGESRDPLLLELDHSSL